MGLKFVGAGNVHFWGEKFLGDYLLSKGGGGVRFGLGGWFMKQNGNNCNRKFLSTAYLYRHHTCVKSSSVSCYFAFRIVHLDDVTFSVIILILIHQYLTHSALKFFFSHF